MMWVRSQNKSALIKCNNIFVNSQFVHNGVYYEIKSSVNDMLLVLGTYSKKEDAEKVMDEIQEKICDGNGKVFYQMPKDYNGWND